MKRATALDHGFKQGQTVLYAGRGLHPHGVTLPYVFTRYGRRIMLRSDDTGHASVSFNVTDPFWAAPAVPDAKALLGELADRYVFEWFAEVRTPARSAHLAGMAALLAEAAAKVNGWTAEAATVWVVKLTDGRGF